MMATEKITKLFAGPWVGEFGWELFCWQGLVRRYVKENSIPEVIVACRPGHGFIYEDFATEIIEYDPGSENTDCMRNLEYVYDNMHNKYVKESGEKWLTPFQVYNTLVRAENGAQIPYVPNQVFHCYSTPVKETGVDIIVHARATNKAGTGVRNWPIEKWSLFERALKSGTVVGSIGSKKSAHHVPNTLDLRGLPLENVCKYISGAKLVVGPSSGPMHLASLCKTPHLVWSGAAQNVDRYKKFWNPFDTPVCMLEPELGWDPPVEAVIESFGIFI
jgi:hypothetical protein